MTIIALSTLAACGGARAAPAAAPEPAPEAAPAAPRMHLVSLSAALPQATRTAAGLAPDGTVYCRQTYFASPPEDERHCIADGHGLTARVLHAIDASGTARAWLEAPLEIRRISDCGNGERLVRRAPAALRARLAPDLADAPAADAVDLRSVQFASCPDVDLALRFPDGLVLEARGSVLRLVSPDAPAAVELVREHDVIGRWEVPESVAGDERGPGLELEVLCNETYVVVAGGVVLGGHETATRHEDTLACAPSATERAEDWQSFERVRIDRRDGASTAIDIAPPRLDTSL